MSHLYSKCNRTQVFMITNKYFIMHQKNAVKTAAESQYFKGSQRKNAPTAASTCFTVVGIMQLPTDTRVINLSRSKN